ncbi:MAG: peptide ABC transporter substrate-binding protein [Candidatus Saccharimonas sp.]
MEEQKKGWKQFKPIKLDRKRLARRVKRAEGVTQRHAHRFIVRRINNIRLVSREITTWLFIVGGMIAAIGLQLYWGQQQYMEQASVKGGTYVEGVIGQVDTLNPLYVSTASEASVARLIFSSLYNYDQLGSIHQDLASQLSVDQTGKIYTVKMRGDATWHDGKKVTAKDVVFTINVIKNPAARSPLRINWLDVSAVAVDDTTVQFTLPAVYAAFPHALTFPVLPQHELQNVTPAALRESTFSRAPVGSGPFSFRLLQAADAVSKHKVVHLLANEHYYDGAPKVSRFELHAFLTEESLLSSLKAGELSGASGLSSGSLSVVDGKRYNTVPQAKSSGVYLLLNMNNATLKDIKVRKALQVGTDTALLRKKVGGKVNPLDGPILLSQLDGEDVPRLPVADSKKAATLLDEAGWTLTGSDRMKEGKKLEFTITTTNRAENSAIVDSLTEQWRQLGIQVHRKTVDTSRVSSTFVQDTLLGRNYEILLYELAIGADPDVYAYWHSSQIGQTGYNFTNYSSKAADASLASARSRLEPNLRNAKYKQFVRQWQEDAPAIALYQPVQNYAYNKNVDSVTSGSLLANEADRYAKVQYWTVHSTAVYKTP